MELGFVTLPVKEKIGFAASAGFDGVEVALGRWASKDLDMTAEAGRKAKDLLAECKLKPLTVALCENYAEDADPVGRMKRTIEVADILETDLITINAWVPKGLKREEKFAYYKTVWTQFAKLAESSGKKIAIENCPHDGLNLGSCPSAFRRMFDMVPSKAVGLQFDPSHFIFQFMEYLPAIREFGDRIYAFHAKDTQILGDKLNQCGIYGDHYLQEPWWRFRMPGYGDADWKGIFTALSDIKYEGPIIIEHEDPTYEGEEGLRRGAKFLRQFIL